MKLMENYRRLQEINHQIEETILDLRQALRAKDLRMEDWQKVASDRSVEIVRLMRSVERWKKRAFLFKAARDHERLQLVACHEKETALLAALHAALEQLRQRGC